MVASRNRMEAGLKGAFSAQKRVVPRKTIVDKTCPTLNELALRAVVAQVRSFFCAE